MYFNMDWQLLLNLNLYHCMRPYSGHQDVLGNGLTCPVQVSVCLCGGSLNVYAKPQLLAIDWNLNRCPQVSECYCSHLNFWVQE